MWNDFWTCPCRRHTIYRHILTVIISVVVAVIITIAALSPYLHP